MTEVVAALIWDGDRFLICRRPANKARALLWEFVGGKTEPGESLAEALIRENENNLAQCKAHGCRYCLIDEDYDVDAKWEDME